MNKYRNTVIMVIADAVLFACAYLGAYLIRFEFAIPADHMGTLRLTIVPAILCKMIVAQLFGLYRGMWRYTSLSDLLTVLRAVAVASLLIFSALLFARPDSPYSRATLLLDGLLTFVFLAGLRVAIRLYFTHSWERFFTPDFYRQRGADAARTPRAAAKSTSDCGPRLRNRRGFAVRSPNSREGVSYLLFASFGNLERQRGPRSHAISSLMHQSTMGFKMPRNDVTR